MALFQLVALYCRWSAVQQLIAKAPPVGFHNDTSKIRLWCYYLFLFWFIVIVVKRWSKSTHEVMEILWTRKPAKANAWIFSSLSVIFISRQKSKQTCEGREVKASESEGREWRTVNRTWRTWRSEQVWTLLLWWGRRSPANFGIQENPCSLVQSVSPR